VLSWGMGSLMSALGSTWTRLRWAWTGLGAFIFFGTLVLDAIQLATLPLSLHFWLALGAVLFLAGGASIVGHMNQERRALAAKLRAFEDAQAALEIRFEPRPPYQFDDALGYRIGVYNSGPVPARNVKVEATSLTPNPIRDYILPSRLIAKGDHFRQGGTINRREEALLDVLAFGVTKSAGRGEYPTAHLQIDEGPASFEPQPGGEYRLRIDMSWENAPEGSDPGRDFIIRAEGLKVLFYPADPPTSS
jgi:hypothetical protein